MLQTSLLEWSVHVSRLRESYTSLNFFTTDQLVFLAGQLAALVHKNAPLAQETAMLLNLIGRGRHGTGTYYRSVSELNQNSCWFFPYRCKRTYIWILIVQPIFGPNINI